ncbi:MAG: OmpA family protein [bacterium]|nr:OmpA family protein [bacterium]
MRQFLFLALAVFLLNVDVTAQSKLSSSNKKALKSYEEARAHSKRFRFEEAIESLKLAIRRDPGFIEAYMFSASMYKRLGNNTQAIILIEQGLVTNPGYPGLKKYYQLIGSTYFEVQDYKKAEGYLKAYLDSGLPLKDADKKQIELMIRKAQFAKEAIKKPVEFDPQPLNPAVNSFPIQYFPVLTIDENQIIFTARRGVMPGMDEDIYVSRKDSIGEWGSPKLISPDISRPGINEGACSISADGKVLVFTICKDRRGLGSCDLYISKKTGKHWSYPVNMKAPVNSSAWESQPALSADGRTIYFVSDRKGGIGKLDIWVSRQNENDEWSIPENLGPTINTQFDDITPSIHPNNLTLYFSSEGHPGFGGYDLFMSEKNDRTWESPRNMGYPLNDEDDQVSLFVTADGERGFFSKETEKNQEYESKLYTFEIPVEDRVKTSSIYLTGQVTDDKTNKPLGAKIKIYNLENSEQSYNVSSDSITGEYFVVLNEGGNYGLYATKIGYIYKEFNFDLKDPKHVLSRDTINIELSKINVGQIGTLKNVFFDFDKSDIKDESKPELDVFVNFLSDNDGVKVEIQGHTDNQGSDSYNNKLSTARAKSVYQYLVDKGIDESRLLYKGFGAKKPIADNNSEFGRSKNRRIEFIIR